MMLGRAIVWLVLGGALFSGMTAAQDFQGCATQ